MNPNSSRTNTALGFLTVIEHADQGLFGGYLVLNTAGRPLEFLCTAPIKPNRAQEILYGDTLESYLFGEQIGQTLVDRSKIETLAVCTDREPVLTLRDHVDVPVALVLPTESEDDAEHPISENRQLPTRDLDQSQGIATLPTNGKQWRLDRSHPSGHSLITLRMGRNRLALAIEAREDCPQIEQRLSELIESFDLSEPFERIREAIEEARRGG